MRGTRFGLACVALVLVALASAGAAAQQNPPPPSAPPQQPGPTQPAPAVTQSRGTATAASGPEALRAAAALARETLALAELGGFGTPPNARVAAAISGLPASGDAADALDVADADGVALLPRLTNTTREVQQALGPLGAADLEAARDGRVISLDPESYVRALSHLTLYDGGPPPAPSPPDPAGINATLRSLDLDDGRGVGGVSGDGGGGLPVLPLVVLLAAVAAVAAVVLTLRRRPAQARAAFAPVAPPTVVPPATTGMQDLLEVSRRLTSAAATGDIDRAVLRDAVGLLHADGAALVRFQGERLTVAAESEPDLVVAEALDDGAIRRVAETGQPLVQVSATEPAIRHLPAALAAYPLVGGGRVEAVLVLVRNPARPFNAADRDVLQALAPVAAAALHSARQARAAIEDSLVDALTGVGNRRRFDSELAAALRDAAGEPTSLFICDLDRFKSVNDTHGHPAGDALLKQVAALMRDTIRPGDSLYRFGGEEFCALLRSTVVSDAAEVAERVRAAVEARPFSIGGPEALRATASFGVASALPHDTDAAGLLARADAALYEAKQSGRNRVVTN